MTPREAGRTARGPGRSQRLWLTALVGGTLLAACSGDGMGPGGLPDPQRPEIQGGRLTALINAQLLNPATGQVTTEATIVTHRGYVISIGSGDGTPIPDSAVLVDAESRWVVPGLIDTHTHLATNYQELTGRLPNRSELDAMTEAQLTLYLLNGVTTIVNLGDFGEPLIRFRNEVLRAEMVGPNIVTARYARGPVNSGDGGPRDQSVRDSADAIAFFDRAVEEGYDMIKIYNWTPASAARELLRRSVAAGVPVSGHFPLTLHPRNTLERGLANVAHASAYHWTWFAAGDTPQTLADAAETTRAAGATISSTLGIMETVAQVWGNNTSGIEAYWARPENQFMHWTERDLHERGIAGTRWNPPGATPGGYDDDLEAIRRHARAMVQAGVPMMTGTDSPTVLGVAGYSMHRELEAMTRIGLSPLETLAAATSNPGTFLEQRLPALDRVGHLVPGAVADLLILDADPRGDVAALAQPWRVMARGALHDPADLLDHVRALQGR